MMLHVFKQAKADYGYMSLSELICDADYAVMGQIVKIDKNYFYLKVDSCLLGRLDFDTIAIVKFEDWPCAKRFDSYKIGQREIAFFRKSNYVIDDFEFLGYGAGDEFELLIGNDSTINYQSAYGEIQPYRLAEFVQAVEDYSKLKDKIAGTSKTITNKERQEFGRRSPLHKLFIECKSRGSGGEDFVIPKTGVIVDLEKRFLYTDYENKISVVFPTAKPYKYYIEVEDAEVRKEKDYFIVKPKSAWTRRWVNVYMEGKDSILFNQLFEIIDLPEPRIYFGNHVSDTIDHAHYRDLLPGVRHYLDDMHYDERLEYKLLSYDYSIESGGQWETFHCKTERVTNTFLERIRQIKKGDSVRIENVYVQYPNRQVLKLKGRTAYVN